MKIIVVLFLSAFAISLFAKERPFSIDHRIQLEGNEGWDCLTIDSFTNRLFITRGNHIDVIDLKTEQLVGKITEHIDGAHGVAFVHALNKGYATSGKSSKVIVFDLGTLKNIKEINVGKKPDIIMYDDFSSRVFSFNADDNSVSVIDPQNDTILKTIKLESNPEFAVTDGKGVIYVNLEDKSLMASIDAKDLVVKKTWPIKGCNEPTGLAIDSKSKTLFSACANEVMAVTDIASGNVVKHLKIAKKPDGAAFDNGLAFSYNGSGTLSIFKEHSNGVFEALQELETQKGSRTMAVDPNSHNIYLVAAKYEVSDAKAPQTRPKILPGSVELLVIKK